MTPVFHQFDAPIAAAPLAALQEAAGAFVASREPLQPGSRDTKWWNNFAILAQGGEAGAVRRIIQTFLRTECMAWCRAVLGRDLMFVLTFCHIRHCDPARDPVPTSWHFDAALMGPDVPMVNVWIPLVDVGVTAPGLTFVDGPRRPDALWQRLLDACSAYGEAVELRRRRVKPFSREDAEAAIAADPGVRVFTPRLSAGQAIAFDQNFLHTTQEIVPEMRPRTSLEIRLVSAEVARAAGLLEHCTQMVAPPDQAATVPPRSPVPAD